MYPDISSVYGFSYRTSLPSGDVYLRIVPNFYSQIQRLLAALAGIMVDNHQGFQVTLSSQIEICGECITECFVFFSDGSITVSETYDHILKE